MPSSDENNQIRSIEPIEPPAVDNMPRWARVLVSRKEPYTAVERSARPGARWFRQGGPDLRGS